MRRSPVERRAGQRQQVMDDRQLDLADDRQLVLEQQVVVAVDAAADRVLDRQHAVSRPVPASTASKTSSKLAARQQLRVGVDPPRRGLAERARFSLIRDFHRPSSQLSALGIG